MTHCFVMNTFSNYSDKQIAQDGELFKVLCIRQHLLLSYQWLNWDETSQKEKNSILSMTSPEFLQFFGIHAEFWFPWQALGDPLSDSFKSCLSHVDYSKIMGDRAFLPYMSIVET